jgi:hypothetical protein
LANKLIYEDKKRRLATLEQSLLAAAKGRAIEVPVAEIRKNGLVTALRKRTLAVKTPRSQSSTKRAP